MTSAAKSYKELRGATWGYELEIGDVDKSIALPEHLGRWEYAETDIVNLREPYRYVAADPLGIDPPVGGEINTMPTKSPYLQVKMIEEILEFLRSKKQKPTVCSSVMEGHIHVRIPGLRDDITALKRLTKYIKENQHTVIKECVLYKEHPLMKRTKTARTYLKWDMGRPMPDWMADNIINMAEDFDDFIRIQCCGKDGVSRGRPFRYCVNTYCLKHTDTIEFRCFRATLNLALLMNCFYFVQKFLDAGLNGGPSAKKIIQDNRYIFPPFEYDHEAYLGWEQTKWSKERGKKERRYIPVA